jgi:hypothetical protein
VLNALIQADFDVFLPFGDGQCFDLVAGLPNGDLARIQVKSGRLHRGILKFNCASTDHGRGRQHHRDRVDLCAVHAYQLEQVFMIPPSDCANFRGHLRLTPPANNQRSGVRMAADYAFTRWAEQARSLELDEAD